MKTHNDTFYRLWNGVLLIKKKILVVSSLLYSPRAVTEFPPGQQIPRRLGTAVHTTRVHRHIKFHIFYYIFSAYKIVIFLTIIVHTHRRSKTIFRFIFSLKFLILRTRDKQTNKQTKKRNDIITEYELLHFICAGTSGGGRAAVVCDARTTTTTTVLLYQCTPRTHLRRCDIGHNTRSSFTLHAYRRRDSNISRLTENSEG